MEDTLRDLLVDCNALLSVQTDKKWSFIVSLHRIDQETKEADHFLGPVVGSTFAEAIDNLGDMIDLVFHPLNP